MWPPRWVRTHTGLFRSNEPCWCLYSYINTYNFSFKLKYIFCVTAYFGYNAWYVTRSDRKWCRINFISKATRKVEEKSGKLVHSPGYDVKYVYWWGPLCCLQLSHQCKCWHLHWINLYVPYVPYQHYVSHHIQITCKWRDSWARCLPKARPLLEPGRWDIMQTCLWCFRQCKIKPDLFKTLKSGFCT